MLVAQAGPTLVTHQAPLSMGFSRQEYWSGLPFLSTGGLPNPGIEAGGPPTLQADPLPSEYFKKLSLNDVFLYFQLYPETN